MSKRPWIIRPLTWVVVLTLVLAARYFVDERRLLNPLFFIVLLVLVVAVVVQSLRWGNQFTRWLAVISGAVTFVGAIYLARLPDDYNGIGDVALIMLSCCTLALAAWTSQPGGPQRRSV